MLHIESGFFQALSIIFLIFLKAVLISTMEEELGYIFRWGVLKEQGLMQFAVLEFAF